MAKTKTGTKTRGLSLEKRFLAHVDKQEDGCWAWTSVVASCGRGLFRISSSPTPKWLKAHLAAKLIFDNEVLPMGYEGHHTCLNGKCVNPAHVKIISRADHRAEHRRLKGMETA